jgi:drug/metabolite transporter (DMT)-like permease
MDWQILTAISVLTLSISILLQRVLLHKDKSDPIAYVVIFQGLVGTLTVFFAISQGFQMPNFGEYWLPIVATVVLYSAGHIAYAKTLQTVEASAFSILFATSAIWIMLISFLLFQERLSIEQLIGALLIFASVGMLAERSGKLKLDKGVLLGLLTGLLFGLATVAWVYVGKSTDTASWTALSFLGPSLLVLSINPKCIPKIKPLLSGRTLARIIILGSLISISTLTLLAAYKIGQASLVAPLQQTSIVITVLLAIIFLSEKTRLWQKGVAAMVCFFGVLLIL